MASSKEKGNDPQRWQKLLESLDEKLQLGLLDYLQKAAGYHFEEDTLFIEPANDTDHDYLSRDEIVQQLQLLAQDAVGIEKLKIKKPSA